MEINSPLNSLIILPACQLASSFELRASKRPHGISVNSDGSIWCSTNGLIPPSTGVLFSRLLLIDTYLFEIGLLSVCTSMSFATPLSILAKASMRWANPSRPLFVELIGYKAGHQHRFFDGHRQHQGASAISSSLILLFR